MDVVCLGEILMDMTPVQGDTGTLYEPNPGGAPANVAVALSRLEKRTAFIGTVGNDFLGELLRHTLKTQGVDISCLSSTPLAPTTLALVHLDGNGERDFFFYRQPGADLFLSWENQEKNLIQKTKIFHFGSLSMTTPHARHITYKALSFARKNKKIISFDPNIRPNLWPTLQTARRTILSVFPKVDILKLSEEELLFLSRRKTLEDAIHWLRRYPIPYVLITRGKDGVLCLSRGTRFSCSSYSVSVVDTTGAGDGFVGGFLSRIVEEDTFPFLPREKILEILRWASAVAALTLSRRGAIPALPSKKEVEHFLLQYGR